MVSLTRVYLKLRVEIHVSVLVFVTWPKNTLQVWKTAFIHLSDAKTKGSSGRQTTNLKMNNSRLLQSTMMEIPRNIVRMIKGYPIKKAGGESKQAQVGSIECRPLKQNWCVREEDLDAIGRLMWENLLDWILSLHWLESNSLCCLSETSLQQKMPSQMDVAPWCYK